MPAGLTDFALAGAHPLLVFATAYRYGYEDVALAAARQAVLEFDENVMPLYNEYIDELMELNAGSYYRLLEFFRAGDPRGWPPTPLLSSSLVRSSVRARTVPSYSSAEWSSHSALPYPFSMPSADLVLRTCDGVEFKVHSDLLRLASPFFNSQLSQSTRPASREGNCEVGGIGRVHRIDLPEHSRTIAPVMQYLYPVGPPSPAVDAKTASLLLQAARKYDISLAIAPLQAHFLKFMNTRPMAVFAIACAQRWPYEARSAAIATMRLPVANSYVEELDTEASAKRENPYM